MIQTDAVVWRENKTLIYTEHPSIWDTVYEGLLSDGTGPTFRLVLGSVEADEFKMMATKSKLVLISKIALDSIGTEAFKKLSVNNVIYLEEIHLMYPHLGDAWDGTKEDAAVIMAGLLRYRKVAGVWCPRAPLIGCVKEDSAPPRLWWITQFFKHEKSKRAAEIRKCLRENSKSRLIDKILLLNESPQEFPASSKIVEEVIGHRLTYQDVIERVYTIPDDVIVVFANADIFIDDNSWRDIWSLNLEDKFLALLRYDVSATWDVAEAKIFGPRADSQDTWVVRAVDIKKRAKDSWNLGFKFGKMGCDNLLALEMMKQKFIVSNPSQSLRTYHVHTSDIRNYNKTDVIEAPVFHYIQPSAINDLQAEFKLPKVQPSVLKRHPHGSAASIDAWKKALKPSLNDSFEEFTPSAEQRICVDRPCFQTTEGLVFDSNKMYIGETATSKLLWNNSKIHGMMPSLGVGHALIVPWPVGADKSKEVYCVRYISKVLRLWSGQGEFFGSEEPAFEQVLQLFTWNEESLPIITREDNSLIWCKSAEGFCHGENPVLKEDIDALRKYMRGWVGKISGRKMVVMEDGIVMTSAIVLELEKGLEAAGYDVKVVYPSKTSVERLVDVFSGAWGVVSACAISAVGWNWMLPVGAHVFEVNSSKTIGIEISSASQLNHYFVSKTEIVEQVGLASALAEAKAQAKADTDLSLPTVWLPEGKGFFAHPGDSFREMVGLWKKAGYINVRQHEGTQVWWGSVGADGVLLYDRPTNEWRLAAPEAEREWRLALFGNPKPSATSAVPWTFWPRRPSLVELALVTKGFDERKQGPVFYGKTENAVQERRRQGDWASVCEEFVMVKDNYPLTQTEYLEKLASSRFGLCLPGYGFKCHREIECMAMGCVPLVSEWVDMSSYANPPVEGKHYIRLKNSREIPSVVASVSKESWEEMSAACRTWWAENASCKGSFELTQRLCSVAESNVVSVSEATVSVATVSVATVSGNVVTDVSGNE